MADLLLLNSGQQVSKPRCMEKEAGHVEEKYCQANKKPRVLTRICNKHLCPAKWWAGPWQHCSVTCGSMGLRKRTVICVRSLGPEEQLALLDKDCEGEDKLQDTEPCRHKHPCPGEAEWSIDEWSQCSKSCDGGQQYRNVTCKKGLECSFKSKPVYSRGCNMQPCRKPANDSKQNPNEVLDDQLGGGINRLKKAHKLRQDQEHRLRRTKVKVNNKDRPRGIVKDVVHTVAMQIPVSEIGKGSPTPLVEEDTLQVEKEPPVIGVTNQRRADIPKEKFEWRMGDWGKCSKDCGGGVRVREALCFNTMTERLVMAMLCDPFTMEETQDFCNVHSCLNWEHSEWETCSTSCGEGTIQRRVWCPKSNGCSLSHKPRLTMTCSNQPCPKWVAGPWSQCSVTCGSGIQLRHVKCIDPTTQTPSSSCHIKSKPVHQLNCNVFECPELKAAFSKCDNEMSMCQSLRHMCQSNYMKIKCCRTCRSVFRKKARDKQRSKGTI